MVDSSRRYILLFLSLSSHLSNVCIVVRERALPCPCPLGVGQCGCCRAALQLEHRGAVSPCSVPPSMPAGVCPCSLPGPGNAYLGNLTRGCQSTRAGWSHTPRPGQCCLLRGHQGRFGGAGSAALVPARVWPCPVVQDHPGLCLHCGGGCPVPIDAAPQYQCMDQSLITAVGKFLVFQPKLSQLSATALSAGCAQRWDRNLQLPLIPLSEALLFGGVRPGVHKVQLQPHPVRFTTDHSTWLQALDCSWLQHHLSHQSRVCGSLLPSSSGSQNRSLPLAALSPALPSHYQ